MRPPSLALTKRVADYDLWSPVEVQKRQAELARAAVKCWPR